MAGTITDIVNPFELHNGLVVVLAAIISAIIWNLVTWFYGIPSSSSHALIGSVQVQQLHQLVLSWIFIIRIYKIIIVLIISPIIAFCGLYHVFHCEIVFKMRI